MAQQEEPLYDFPEPTQSSARKLLGLQRGRASLRSISVLDRLLLTVPVWLQLSINAATALHILQREPPGTFLVRKSRTSQTNVLCVRLADDSVPSFVQQFGIREEQCTLSLETSAISFPDLPRLISFYCVSRDVLPFPLELPEAIARATSHKELESISHMGIEFWSSHLNVRGPREAPKLQEDNEKKPEPVTSASPAAPPQTTSDDSTAPPDPDNQVRTAPAPDTTTKPTLFHEFCPITTRSPRELDCGSGLGALCFINPLFLQSQNILSARRLFKRSLKVRISTETSTLLSPPLAPPPPPPLMPKTKGRCKGRKQGTGLNQLSEGIKSQSQSQSTAQQPLTQTQDSPTEAPVQPPSEAPDLQPEPQEQPHTEEEVASAQLPVMEHLPDDSDYMHPLPMTTVPHPPSLSPYLSPAAHPSFPKVSPPLSTHSSPAASPSLSLSPYQFPSASAKVPRSLSPHDSPSASPSLSPYQSPAPSPKLPFSLSPFTPIPFSQLTEQAYHTPPPPTRADRPRSERDDDADEEEECAAAGETRDGDGGTVEELHGKDEECVDIQMNVVSLNGTDSCSSFSSLEGAAETPPLSPLCKESSL